MRSDIHHLFPTDKDFSSARGSVPFGEIPDQSRSRWYGLTANGQLVTARDIPVGDGDTYSEDRPDEFEPREAHEGDLARAVFYFYTMYPRRAGPVERLAKDGTETLYQWHVNDPPDAWERQRNSRIEVAQGNRNPYVDHPELLCRAWGFDCP